MQASDLSDGSVLVREGQTVVGHCIWIVLDGQLKVSKVQHEAIDVHSSLDVQERTHVPPPAKQLLYYDRARAALVTLAV